MARKKTYHHGDLRKVILAVARDEIVERGVSGLLMRSVARRAGVSEAAPYHHFQGRDGLLCEIAREGFSGLAGKLEDAWASGADPSSRARAVAVAYATFCVEHPAQFRAMFGEHMEQIDAALRPREEGGAALAVLNRVAREMTDSLGLTVPLSTTETVLWSAMHGVASLLIEREVRPGAGESLSVIEHAAKVVVAGLKAL